MKQAPLTLFGLAGLVSVAAAQPLDTKIVHGACQAESSVTNGGKKTAYTCDNAVFSFFDNQNSHVMIQFAKKGDGSVPLLGFAGAMEKDGVTLDVDRIYLRPGEAQPAQKASCKLSFGPPNITGISCSGQAAQSALRVVFKADPGQ